MFGKKGTEAPVNYEKIDTLIGQGTTFQGTISASGTVRVDGAFKGEIKTQGDLVIGETGKVEGNIDARNVLIGGQVEGNIQASGKVDLSASGKVFGDMKVKNLVIEEGALFKGNCLMEAKSDSIKSPKENVAK